MYGAMLNASAGSSFRKRQTAAMRSFLTKAQSSPPTPSYGSDTASGKRCASASITAFDMVPLSPATGLAADDPVGLVLDLLLQEHDPVEDQLRPGRAARDVHVDRDDAVDALDGGVAPLVAAARARAVAHGDAPLGLRHLLPEADQRAGHLGREGAGDDEHVRLPRAGAEREHAPAV